MRLSLRFVVPLIIALAALAYACVPILDRLTLRWFARDLDLRAAVIANAAQEPLSALIDSGATSRMIPFFNRLTRDERLYAVGYCRNNSAKPVATSLFPPDIRCDSLNAFAVDSRVTTDNGTLHVAVVPMDQSAASGRLVLVHDMSFVERRSEETRTVPVLFFRRLGLSGVAYHRRHRATELARLGAGHSRRSCAARALRAARRTEAAPELQSRRRTTCAR